MWSLSTQQMLRELKLIKTRIRNRLAESTLDSLLRIPIEGSSPEDYPFSDQTMGKEKEQKIEYKVKYTCIFIFTVKV